ncbi:hypothetical protein AB0H71_01985 [Nocardia sp. NPDC050697]|uniref:hypothetical protein n=1 Tax=Nocardia sp. NPDC050697 TaxID=3155158 RepID=UPI003409B6EE
MSPMRIALVCGDGLPVSGLLTIFRNVRELGRSMGIVENSVAADLGYSWRPDKKRFFPAGNGAGMTAPWMEIAVNAAVTHLDPDRLAAEIDELRRLTVRFDDLDSEQCDDLTARTAQLRALYTEHFEKWLARHQPDWVFAVNTTLPDAVFVTRALHEAAAAFYRDRPGGLLVWDHDLFGSCAVWDAEAGQRHYPAAPNAATPLPAAAPHLRWVVVSETLAREARRYPTTARPRVVPNILPAIGDSLETRHRQAAAQLGLDPGRPVLLNPVRVFRVKGVDLAIRLHHAVIEHRRLAGAALPYLLVFGALDEDPGYATEVIELVERLGTGEHVRFLNGVPLGTSRDEHGRWYLDEADLLTLARVSRGGVVFTPSVPDVETVGLGPALAARAAVPCVVTGYDVFPDTYGPGFTCTRFATTGEGLDAAAAAFADDLTDFGRDAPALLERLRINGDVVDRRFPDQPWRSVLTELQERLRYR